MPRNAPWLAEAAPTTEVRCTCRSTGPARGPPAPLQSHPRAAVYEVTRLDPTLEDVYLAIHHRRDGRVRGTAGASGPSSRHACGRPWGAAVNWRGVAAVVRRDLTVAAGSKTVVVPAVVPLVRLLVLPAAVGVGAGMVDPTDAGRRMTDDATEAQQQKADRTSVFAEALAFEVPDDRCRHVGSSGSRGLGWL